MKIIQMILLLTLISSSFAFLFNCRKTKRTSKTTATTVTTTTSRTTTGFDGSGQIDPRQQRVQQATPAPPVFGPAGR
jgi:hypothetical protein